MDRDLSGNHLYCPELNNFCTLRLMMTLNLENENLPLVSIIIPFFNREKYLAETIESVIAQTYEKWELLLVDDGSTDRGREICKEYIKEYPDKIHLLFHPEKQNKGASVARNLGIQNAKGNFITFLDSDDIFYPFTIEKELNGFKSCIEADAVCGTAEVWYSWSIDKDDWNKDFKIDLVLETDKLYQPPDLLLHNLNANGRKPHFNATLLKREFIEKIGGFEEEFKSVGEDQALWAKVSLHGKIYVLDDSLAKYRQHPESTCAYLTEKGTDADSWGYFFGWLEKYLNSHEITDQEVWRALNDFKDRQKFEKKLTRLKQIYRRILPLHLRYKIRDKLTKAKKVLSRSAHR